MAPSLAGTMSDNHFETSIAEIDGRFLGERLLKARRKVTSTDTQYYKCTPILSRKYNNNAFSSQ